MTTSHTPGPWRAAHIDGGMQVCKNHIKDITGIFRSEEGMANAYLIAQAPAMLDLLRKLAGNRRKDGSLCWCLSAIDGHSPECSRARDVVAMATGEMEQ